MSGSEDFLIRVAVRDNQDLYAFVIDRLTERPEIADVRNSVVYEHLHKSKFISISIPAGMAPQSR